MATDTQTPARPAAAPVDPERPTNPVIPLILLVALLLGLAYGVNALMLYVKNANVSAGQELKFVLRRMEMTVKPFGDLPPMPKGLFVALCFVPLVTALLLGFAMVRKVRTGLVDTPPHGGYWDPWEKFSGKGVLGMLAGLFVLCLVPAWGAMVLADRRPPYEYLNTIRQSLGISVGLMTVLVAVPIYILALLACYAVMELVNWWRAGRPVTWWWRTFFMLALLGAVYNLVSLGFIQATGGKGIDPIAFWVTILVFYVSIVLAFVAWMYYRDVVTVGPLWATFLGLTRAAAWLLLAGVFLMPALQTWDRTESFSRVLILLDLSGSMQGSDVVTADGKPGDTRLDNVNKLFTKDDGAFFKALQKQNPVFRLRLRRHARPRGARVQEGRQRAAVGPRPVGPLDAPRPPGLGPRRPQPQGPRDRPGGQGLHRRQDRPRAVGDRMVRQEPGRARPSGEGRP
jgi:hypothetical protein